MIFPPQHKTEFSRLVTDFSAVEFSRKKREFPKHTHNTKRIPGRRNMPGSFTLSLLFWFRKFILDLLFVLVQGSFHTIGPLGSAGPFSPRRFRAGHPLTSIRSDKICSKQKKRVATRSPSIQRIGTNERPSLLKKK